MRVIKQKAIIVDLDGTMANSEHRVHYVRNKPKNWPAFYEGMALDKPNAWCKKIVKSFIMQGYTPIFLTGRPEAYRQITKDWLVRECQIQPFQCQLYMRADKDHRPDYIVKKEIFYSEINDKYDILFVMDDRKQVVDMFRELGLIVLHCAEGDF